MNFNVSEANNLTKCECRRTQELISKFLWLFFCFAFFQLGLDILVNENVSENIKNSLGKQYKRCLLSTCYTRSTSSATSVRILLKTCRNALYFYIFGIATNTQTYNHTSKMPITNIVTLYLLIMRMQKNLSIFITIH